MPGILVHLRYFCDICKRYSCRPYYTNRGNKRLKTKDMTLQQLEYILALNRLGNFAKAADYCDVTQPTLSSMIQKLENELGIKIFDRRRQPIVTTKAGQAVIRQAKEVLYQSRRLREIVEEEKDTYLGTFTIGVLPTIAPYLIPHFFPQLMREHPEMDLRIVELKTKDMKQALLNGDIDAGILAKIEGLEMFNSTHLYTEKYFAYISEMIRCLSKNASRPPTSMGSFCGCSTRATASATSS